jgi:hypothetical protein
MIYLILFASGVVAGTIYGVWLALDSEAEFDDENIDELCGHDWNPQPDNTKPKEPNDP